MIKIVDKTRKTAYNNIIMGGLYSHQRVERRRYLPHLNTGQAGSVGEFFSALGGRVLRIIKTFAGIAAVFFLALWKKVSCVLKEFFLRLFNIILYNPLFHKVALSSFITLLVVGALFLVFFALFSPELPPGNLISTMGDINDSHNGYSMSHVILSDSEDDWAAQTMLDDSTFDTGAGSQVQDRTKDFEYPIRPGETLSEIAYAYDIPYDFLAWYNKISNPNRIRFGTVITIPSIENISANETQYQQYKTKQRQPPPARTVKSIEITYESRDSGTGLGTGITAHFSIVNPPSNLRSYEWDMGDGRRSFRESPSYEYSAPRTYTVRLTAQDDAGVIYRSNHLYIDIPHPATAAEHSTTRFATLSSPDDYFVVNGTIEKIARYANIEDAVDLTESDRFLTKVRFKKSGYYGITVDEGGRRQYYSVFVSPIPTVHADQATVNFNWYRTQFNSGTPSNCGPASASMAISWVTGSYFPVSAVRQAVGWQGDGGTSFDELIKVIKSQGVEASLQPLRTAQNLKDVIDAGGIAIILFLTDGVRSARGNPATDLFGTYYNDSVGHYIVVKGYSLNGEYFVVHDPIPSDWSANSFRYADEISMMGRNRYFPAGELLRSLRRHEMIVVSK